MKKMTKVFKSTLEKVAPEALKDGQLGTIAEENEYSDSDWDLGSLLEWDKQRRSLTQAFSLSNQAGLLSKDEMRKSSTENLHAIRVSHTVCPSQTLKFATMPVR